LICSVDLSTNQLVNKTSSNQNAANLYEKLKNDPYLAKEVYNLYAGASFAAISKPIVDDDSTIIIDAERIDCTLELNSFGSLDISNLTRSCPQTSSSAQNNAGLWLFPSYFNHSCVANTMRIFIKDIMLVYALRDIEQGEEVTLKYVGYDTYANRGKSLRSFGFECDCRLCELDRADDQEICRELLIYKHQNFNAAGDQQVELCELEDFFNRMKSTYDKTGRSELKFAMIQPTIALAEYFHTNGEFSKAGHLFLDYFNMTREYDHIDATVAIFHAINNFHLAKDQSQANKCALIARAYFDFNYQLFDFFRNHLQLNFADNSDQQKSLATTKSDPQASEM
jgi:hypothetical protein